MPVKPTVEAGISMPAMHVLHAQRVACAGEAGERARDGHRDRDRALDRDAAVARALGVEADGAYLVAERRAVQQHPEQHHAAEGDEDPDVHALELAPDRAVALAVLRA